MSFIFIASLKSKPFNVMAQCSYWRQVKVLYDWYEYTKQKEGNINPTLAEAKELLKQSIADMIKHDKPHMNIIDVYESVLRLKDRNKLSIEDAIIMLGQEWYDED